jgi:streptomycin 3"-adenylyltransferase
MNQSAFERGTIRIPNEAGLAAVAIIEALGGSALGVYLYGSAVAGGLRRDSDVDILAVVSAEMSEKARRALAEKLPALSGKVGNPTSVRSLELTVVHRADIVPWRYPPRKEFVYGEWLREEFERGLIPVPTDDPDLAILLYQARQNSVPLFGLNAQELLDPIPLSDVRTAMRDCLPGLIDWLKGDERNVLLTFARIWATASTGDILPKDEAAAWAASRLPPERARLLELAGKAYRGELADNWEGLYPEALELVLEIKKEIEYLNRVGG